MANGKIRFGKQSGGELALIMPDGVTNTEVTFPESGELVNKAYADLKQSKSELAYDVNTSSYIPNTLSSGAIIERGSNTNGEYIKFADGTLICTHTFTSPETGSYVWTYPLLPISPIVKAFIVGNSDAPDSTIVIRLVQSTFIEDIKTMNFITNKQIASFCRIGLIGRWK